MMPIVIVAGGLATRMQPLTENIPKCLIDINGTPLIEHQLRFFKKLGYTKIIFCIAHLADKVKDYFGDGSAYGLKISYAEEQEQLLGTAGSVKKAASLIDGDKLIVFYGDVLTSLDVGALLDFHSLKNADATVCVRPLPEGYRSSSLVMMDETNAITHFIEKPDLQAIARFSSEKKYINSGIYVLQKEVLELIPQHSAYDFAKHLFPLMMGQRRNLYGYVMHEFFREVGSIKKYGALLAELKGKAPLME